MQQQTKHIIEHQIWRIILRLGLGNWGIILGVKATDVPISECSDRRYHWVFLEWMRCETVLQLEKWEGEFKNKIYHKNRNVQIGSSIGCFWGGCAAKL